MDSTVHQAPFQVPTSDPVCRDCSYNRRSEDLKIPLTVFTRIAIGFVYQQYPCQGIHGCSPFLYKDCEGEYHVTMEIDTSIKG